MTRTRTAIVPRVAPEKIAPYLYSNYHALPSVRGNGGTIIHGRDFAGFTLDAIMDRLASGLYFAHEVTEEVQIQDAGRDAENLEDFRED